MIGIVDYGLGNTQAIVNIYKKLNIDVELAASPEALERADRLILPGVGSFDWAMQLLSRAGLREKLNYLVKNEGRPVLGICVGMQMMARSSEEGGEAGLCWIAADVKRLPAGERRMLPHMGWNDVAVRSDAALMRGLEKDAQFYFLHSYYFAPDRSKDVIGTTDYGVEFACAVQADNVFGVQFHPEKSHSWGVRLLKNFAEI